MIPFNSVLQPLLLERDYFKAQPDHACALTNPHLCQSPSNPPNSFCETGDTYQPPLPLNGTNADGKYFPELEASDIQCANGDSWTTGCTSDFCDSEIDAEAMASYVMSIPYIMSAVLSPVLGGTVRCHCAVADSNPIR